MLKILTRDEFISWFEPFAYQGSFDNWAENVCLIKDAHWLNSQKTPVRQYFAINGKDDERASIAEELIKGIWDNYIVKWREYIGCYYDQHLAINDVDSLFYFQVDNSAYTGDIIEGHTNNVSRLPRNINAYNFLNTKKYSDRSDYTFNILKCVVSGTIIPLCWCVPSVARRTLIEGNYTIANDMLRGACHRATIFNPHAFSLIMNRYYKGAKKLFTPVLGWNSYQIAFYNINADLYVGTDVIPEVCENAKRLHEHYDDGGIFKDEKNIDIYCCPSEQLDTRHDFCNKYKDTFDGVLFSPPYWSLELYPSDNQSTDSFKTYNDWLEGYWAKTCEICQKTLRPGGRFGFIICDWVDLDSNNKELQRISKDMHEVSKRYFEVEKHARLRWNAMTTRPTKRTKEDGGNFENIFMLVKK